VLTPEFKHRDIFVPLNMETGLIRRLVLLAARPHFSLTVVFLARREGYPKPMLIPHYIHSISKEFLPVRLQFSSWYLRFSNIRDGNRLQSLYDIAEKTCSPRGAFVLAISSPKGQVVPLVFASCDCNCVSHNRVVGIMIGKCLALFSMVHRNPHIGRARTERRFCLRCGTILARAGLVYAAPAEVVC